jgi:paraquat-inducible protein B
VDAVTQIAPGDLFDFDFEVAPLVDVLVGRTLEQACAEVAQEAELAAIRSRRAEFEAVRSAELAEVQRMESEVKRRFAEKTRRVEQERERLAREASVREKIAAAARVTLEDEDFKSLPGDLRRTLAELERSLASVGPDGNVQGDLLRTLDELRGALRSIDGLADTIKEKPNSLLFGKEESGNPKPKAAGKR